MIYAKKEAIMAFLAASRHVFPNEFIGLLAGDKKTNTVQELIVLPAVFGESFSSIQLHLLPMGENILGTCHRIQTDTHCLQGKTWLLFLKQGKFI